jgi:outer membrane lipoprotein-sorting protein
MSKLLNRPIVTEGTIAFTVPDKFRREVKGASPSTTISNGKTLWIYYPKFNEAELYTLGQHSFFDDSMQALTAGFSFDHFEEYYRLKAFREENGYRLELVPKRPNLKRLLKMLTLWIDPAFTPLKGKIILPKGDEVTTVYKNVVRTQLAAAVFEFTPPEGVRISKPLGK